MISSSKMYFPAFYGFHQIWPLTELTVKLFFVIFDWYFHYPSATPFVHSHGKLVDICMAKTYLYKKLAPHLAILIDSALWRPSFFFFLLLFGYQRLDRFHKSGATDWSKPTFPSLSSWRPHWPVFCWSVGTNTGFIRRRRSSWMDRIHWPTWMNPPASQAAKIVAITHFEEGRRGSSRCLFLLFLFCS